MTGPIHPVRFPGESDEYRAARDELLKAEIALRQQIADIAALRQKLPHGGPIKEDYAFEELVGNSTVETRLSELFAPGKDSLVLYSFMYGPNTERACPACTSMLDGVNGLAQHIVDRINLAVVAKSPIARIQSYAEKRGWNQLRLLSSNKNTYNEDYHGESPDGAQIPACNVFVRTPDGIRHFWAAELLYAPVEGHPRHMDLMWPIWNFFDLTPEGRGQDWFPKLSYE